jgi:membrane protease YdiL (CAAX protease family)
MKSPLWRVMVITRREKLTIAAFLLAGLIGVFIYVHLYNSAFPSASLNLKVNRSDALRIGERFLSEHGYNVPGYEHVVSFRWSEYDKNYLERNLGLRRANVLMSAKINVWHWSIRWFKPLHEEEFHVEVSPSGKVVDFSHTIPENSPGKSISQSEARALATAFLRAQGLEPAKYEMMEGSSESRPRRVDHYFEWKELGFKAGEAENRVSVSVAGNTVSYFGSSLKVPDTWRRKVEGESGKGGFLVTIASVISAVFLCGLLVVFMFAVRARAVRWKFALALAGGVAFVNALAAVNLLPIMKQEYITTETMAGFITTHIIQIISAVIVLFGGMVFLASGGDVMQRWGFPDKISLSGIFTRRGLRSKRFVEANLVGFGLGLAQLGYVSLFYVIGMKYFHVWSPAEVPYDETLNTALPWIYPLTIGLFAALTEEFVYRVFAISFLKKYLRLTWLAVLVPAVTWAFMHSNYPQQPAYIRGIEISVVGIVLGLAYLRYGVVSTIAAHYTYDAVLGGTLLARSDNLYFRISGIAVMLLVLLPLVPAAVVALRRSALTDDEPVPDSIPEPSPPATVAQELPRQAGSYSGWSRRKLLLIGGIGLAALAVLCVVGRSDYGTQVVVNRKEVRALADKYVREHQLKMMDYRSYVTFGGDWSGMEANYVARRIGLDKADKLLRAKLHGAGWTVTWFKPLNEEQYDLEMSPNGKFYSCDHTVEEDAPGAKLSVNEARALAESWLKDHGVNLSGYRLVDSSFEKKKNRNDHDFTWEENRPRIGDAAFRLSLSVQGNEVVSRDDFVKIPDEYRREASRQTARMSVFSGIFGLIMLGLIIAVFVIFIIQFTRHSLDWKLAFRWSAVATLCAVIQWVNDLPTFFSGYSNTDPLSRFITSEILSFALRTAAEFAGIACLVALADAVYKQAFPDKPSFSQWFGRRAQEGWRCRAFREAVILAYAFLPVMGLFAWASDWVTKRFFPSVVQVGGSGYSTLLDGLSPLLSAIPMSLLALIIAPLMIALIVSLVKLYLRRRWIVVSLLVILPLLSIAGEARNWQSFWLQLLGVAVWLPLVWLLVTRWFGHNAYAYAVLTLASFLAGNTDGLINASDRALRANGIILAVLSLAPAVMAVYLNYRVRRGRETQSESHESI